MENSEYSLIQESINHFDLLVIIIYLLLSLIIGLFGSKLMGLSSTKEEDYYLAGRKMPGWLNGLSNAATALNSDVHLCIAALLWLPDFLERGSISPDSASGCWWLRCFLS